MGSAYQIRPAAEADFDAMLPLFQSFYQEEGFEHAVDRVAPNLSDIIARDDTAAFLAEVGKTVVGVSAASTSFGLEAGLYAELEDLYVVPDYRQLGVASALVEATVSWARDRGCRDVEIVLTQRAQETPKLKNWYEARGFIDTGRRILERQLG